MTIKGCALQCCILDETTQTRKKFVLASFNTKAGVYHVKLDHYFDEDQLPNLTFEIKGRPHVNKENCRVSLAGNFMVGISGKELLELAVQEIQTNRHQEKVERYRQKRKEEGKWYTKENKKARLEEKKEEEEESDVEIETHEYDI